MGASVLVETYSIRVMNQVPLPNDVVANILHFLSRASERGLHTCAEPFLDLLDRTIIFVSSRFFAASQKWLALAPTVGGLFATFDPAKLPAANYRIRPAILYINGAISDGPSLAALERIGHNVTRIQTNSLSTCIDAKIFGVLPNLRVIGSIMVPTSTKHIIQSDSIACLSIVLDIASGAEDRLRSILENCPRLSVLRLNTRWSIALKSLAEVLGVSKSITSVLLEPSTLNFRLRAESISDSCYSPLLDGPRTSRSLNPERISSNSPTESLADGLKAVAEKLPPQLPISQIFGHFYSRRRAITTMGPYSLPACLLADCKDGEAELDAVLPYLDPNAQFQNGPTPLSLIFQVLVEEESETLLKRFDLLLQKGADPLRYFRMYYFDSFSEEDPLHQLPLHNLFHLAVSCGIPKLLGRVLQLFQPHIADTKGGIDLSSSLLFDDGGFSILHYLRPTARGTEVMCCNDLLSKGFAPLLDHCENSSGSVPLLSVSGLKAEHNVKLIRLLLSRTKEPWKPRADGSSLVSDVLNNNIPVSLDACPEAEVKRLLSLLDAKTSADCLVGSVVGSHRFIWHHLLLQTRLSDRLGIFNVLLDDLPHFGPMNETRSWQAIYDICGSPGFSWSEAGRILKAAGKFSPLLKSCRRKYWDQLWVLVEEHGADPTYIYEDAGGYYNSLLDMVEHQALVNFDETQQKHFEKIFLLFTERLPDIKGLRCRLGGLATLWAAFVAAARKMLIKKEPFQNLNSGLQRAVTVFEHLSKGVIDEAWDGVQDAHISFAVDFFYLLSSPAAKNSTRTTEELLAKAKSLTPKHSLRGSEKKNAPFVLTLLAAEMIDPESAEYFKAMAKLVV